MAGYSNGSDNRFSFMKPSPAVSPPNPWAIRPSTSSAFGIGNGSTGASQYIAKPAPKPEPKKTGYSSRASAIVDGGVNPGNRSSTSGSYGGIKVSGANQVTSIGGPENTLTTSPTGDLGPGPTTIGGPENVVPDLTGPDPSPGPGGDGGSSQAVPEPAAAAEAGISEADYLAQLETAINGLLEGTYIDFQGSAADELRRLRNYRDQLYGNDAGMIGSVQRQQTTDLNDRRRLAAQRAVSGMLQGGSYAGAQRGLGTQQQASQAYGVQEMQRPFLEQVQSDRLREFGLDYNFDGKQLGYTDWFDDMIPNMSLDENGKLVLDKKESWATTTNKGRSAQANARNSAIQQLLQRGVTL
jgi:hypothetical protein